MTKKDLARKQAEHMKSVNGNVDVERMITVLMKHMTTHELEKAVENWNK